MNANPTAPNAPPQNIAPAEAESLRRVDLLKNLIDVRTPAEFAELHADGAQSFPLDALDPAAVVATQNPDQPLFLLCKSGGRAAKARDRFAAAGFTNTYVITGGTDAWTAAGLPVVLGPRPVPVERQVRLAAGSLVLLSLALSYLVSPLFLALTTFVGAGLVFAGVTNFCGMALLLSKMPWNRKAADKPANPPTACACAAR